MEGNEPIRKFTREDILALLARGREIKERRQKEAEEWYAERQRRKKEAAESGYYDIEWERWNAECNQIEAKYHDVIIKALRYALSSNQTDAEAQPVIELLRQIIGDDDASTLSPEIVRAALPRLIGTTPQNSKMLQIPLSKT